MSPERLEQIRTWRSRPQVLPGEKPDALIAELVAEVERLQAELKIAHGLVAVTLGRQESK